VLHRGGEHHIGAVVRARERLHAGGIAHEEGARPRGAAIGGTVDAAILALRVEIPLRGDEHRAVVARIDEDGRDLFRGAEPHVRPRAAGVDRFVDAVALIDRAAGDLIAGADPNDIRIRRRDGDGADRGNAGDAVEHRIPDFARARGLPDAGRRRAHVECAGFANGARRSGDASATEGADAAPDETVEHVGRDGRGSQYGEGGESEERTKLEHEFNSGEKRD
jgi:hypothetical protein